jgi:hypothetical protein
MRGWEEGALISFLFSFTAGCENFAGGVLEVTGAVWVPSRSLFFTWAIFVWADAPFALLVCRAFGFLCALALSASVSPLIVLPSPFGGNFERDVAVLHRGSI